MGVVTTEQIIEAQKNTKNIRNICVLAHVDHGKTTLSDFLISSNSIISTNLAGKVRYMDSTAYEQEKKITIKSSSISLTYQRRLTAKEQESKMKNEKYTINLIDSPGHVDFSSEVSTAARLTDGALVVVDVVEGVCSQTRSVLMQAFRENITPCLVLNKIDRLIIEKQMEPMEAYKQLNRILEQVNVLLSTFSISELFTQMDENGEQVSIENESVNSDRFFDPCKGNVVFASAVDGWALKIDYFARVFSKKLNVKQELLEKTLWGECYLHKKTGKVTRKPSKPNHEPMFVQFILRNIFDIYHSIYVYPDIQKSEAILKKFQISPNIIKRTDKRSILKTVLSTWLPLSDAVLGMVVSHIPNPIIAQRRRILKLIPELERLGSSKNKIKSPSTPSNEKEESSGETLGKTNTENQKAIIRSFRKKLKKNLLQCDSSDNAEVLVFVSKMLEVDTLPGAMIDNKQKERIAERAEIVEDDVTVNNQTVVESDVTQDELENSILDESNKFEQQQQYFIGFSRIFSGTIKVGQEVEILLPRYSITNPKKHRHTITVKQLYLLMGRDLQPIKEVSAGNIFGIGGVSKYIMKSATIASSMYSPIMSAMYFHASPIVKYAIEPKDPSEMPKLVSGLKLLNQSDPSVETFVQESGEHVVMTAGEVHAERCFKDLKEKFSKIELEISPPLVSFRETIVVSIEKVKESIHQTANKKCTIKVKAIPLPQSISKFIDEHSEEIKKCTKKHADKDYVSLKVIDELKEEFKKCGKKWEEEYNNLWSLGPNRCGPNILLNHIPYYNSPYFKSLEDRVKSTFEDELLKINKKLGRSKRNKDKPNENDSKEDKLNDTDSVSIASSSISLSKKDHQNIKLLLQFDTSITAGFQLATSAGTLCDEPMMGVCFIIEDIQYDSDLHKSNEQEYSIEEVNDSIEPEQQTEDNDIDKENNDELENNEISSENEEDDDENDGKKKQSSIQMKASMGTFGGQIISATKEVCRKSFNSNQRRLVEAMYLCVIQSTQSALGQTYIVLRRRRAKILNETIEEGSGLFTIECNLPVAESFGFMEELLTATSGSSSPQLEYSHWEVLDIDPFFVPTTEEEIEEYGTQYDSLTTPNIAKDFINKVRERKGMWVQKKIVEHAEKQRTLKRNK